MAFSALFMFVAQMEPQTGFECGWVGGLPCGLMRDERNVSIVPRGHWQ